METKTYGLVSTAANRKIIENLESDGAKVYKFPVFETEKTETAENIKDILAEFEWLIFPDIFAVDFFLAQLETCEIDLFELDEKRILAFGEAVADRLRFSQIHADLIPSLLEPNDIWTAISDYLSADELANTKFLMPKFIGFETDLKEKLEIQEMEIYRIKPETDKETAKLKAFLAGGAIDSFVFSAPEDVFFLKQFLFPNRLREVLADLEIFGTNEITMQTLRENGLRSIYFSGK